LDVQGLCYGPGKLTSVCDNLGAAYSLRCRWQALIREGYRFQNAFSSRSQCT